MRLRRMHEYNACYFVTNRVARGLPFAPNTFIRILLFGILAKAQNMYPGVRINAWIFMPNHYHGVITIKDTPEQLSDFMEYLNGEIAKLFNRLLGNMNQKFWARRYSAQKLLTFEAAMQKIIYLYLNPLKAKLVWKIQDYNCLSTWEFFTSKTTKSYLRAKSSKFKKLPNIPFNKFRIEKLVKDLEDHDFKEYPLILDPFCWMDCFKESHSLNKEEVYQRLIKDLEAEEQKHIEETKQNKTHIPGIEKLAYQSIFKPYIPQNYGKDSICISTCKILREEFKRIYQDFCSKCEEASQKWKHGDFSIKFPAGAFIPWALPIACIFH